nr:hypothetical protein [Pleurocapsa sp. FMAR1]
MQTRCFDYARQQVVGLVVRCLKFMAVARSSAYSTDDRRYSLSLVDNCFGGGEVDENNFAENGT